MWVEHQIYSVSGSIWDLQEYMTFRMRIEYLPVLTRDRHLTSICAQLLDNIPWKDVPIQPKDWLASTNPDPDLTKNYEFYWVHKVLDFGFQFINKLEATRDDKAFISRLETTTARVIYWNIKGKVDSFNPKVPPNDSLYPWIFRDGIVKQLNLDSKE